MTDPWTDILDLDSARKAIDLPAADTSRDTELQATWIPTITSIVEDIAGPIFLRTETLTKSGGHTAILLPYLDATLLTVTENGNALTADTDCSFNSSSGVLMRGTIRHPVRFHRGSNNIVITYQVGFATDVTEVPAKYKTAAAIILANLWQGTKTAFRPGLGGSPNLETTMVPVGYAVPNRALEVLGLDAVRLPGFS